MGNGLAKLTLSANDAKLAQSFIRQFSCSYQPQNTEACLDISTKKDNAVYKDKSKQLFITEKNSQHPLEKVNA